MMRVQTYPWVSYCLRQTADLYMAMNYSDDELSRYFSDRKARRGSSDPSNKPKRRGPGAFFYSRFSSPKKAQAAYALSVLVGLMLIGVFSLGLWFLLVEDDMPSLQQLENPSLDLATIAYTADGEELARYGRQNRSWVNYDQISPNVINALIATEDHRFMNHWGMDVFRTVSAVAQTVFTGRQQGGSTISQQLARNLYNEQIGFEVTVTRKLKEIRTAVELERRYTKREIIEMYLNTVAFGNNAFGIEAAAWTYFGTTAAELSITQAATLVGMLQATTFYNPVRNPENAQRRRNVVMRQMVRHGLLSDAEFQELRTEPVEATRRSAEVTDSFAPYAAEHVRNQLNRWRQDSQRDIYGEGLRVYTTIDSRMQRAAQESVDEVMEGLQSVVDYEWSRASGWSLGNNLDAYRQASDYEPFAFFWERNQPFLGSLIRNTDRFRSLREEGMDPAEAVATLQQNEAFVDSVKTMATRLEAGLVSMDPRSGEIRAWVGGRDLATDWYDHVAISRRQPGSTFKPFVYAAAIDNGYRPDDTRVDSVFTYTDPQTGREWSPSNAGGLASNQPMTLRTALAASKNTIAAQLGLEIEPRTIAFYARRMGIQSPMEEVPALSLGTSDVSLLELTRGYSTLANGGLNYEPTIIQRIEDRFGNVLYEANPSPTEALSEEVAYTVVDMLREAVRAPDGTGQRIQWQFQLSNFDLAGKTGTTQNSADGWFMLMHPDLVTGAWVGFNDQRITFRTGSQWGQGSRNGLLLAGDFTRRIVDHPDELLAEDRRFPLPGDFFDETEESEDGVPDRGRVGW